MSAVRARRAVGTRLSVDDWIELGFTLLAEEGLSGIKVDRLCARMGVTKGSFYWHFTDLPAYMEALAERWGEVRDSARASFQELERLEPAERLRSDDGAPRRPSPSGRSSAAVRELGALGAEGRRAPARVRRLGQPRRAEGLPRRRVLPGRCRGLAPEVCSMRALASCTSPASATSLAVSE